MITPAILILATGSLVASTLTRLGRVIDRARVVLTFISDAQAANDVTRAEQWLRLLKQYRRRVGLAERALTLYYVAIVLFVGASLTIAVIEVARGSIPNVALGLVVAGAVALAAGTACLAVETTLATGILRTEIRYTIGGDATGASASDRSA